MNCIDKYWISFKFRGDFSLLINYLFVQDMTKRSLSFILSVLLMEIEVVRGYFHIFEEEVSNGVLDGVLDEVLDKVLD